MNLLPYAIAAIAAAGVSVALAAPPIPSSVMPGQERNRFTDSPVERFMQPGPYQPPPVVTLIPQGCTPRKQHSKPQSKNGKTC